ncbi:hypothetical protein [Trichormus azollae]
MRAHQFQLPKIILNPQPISAQYSRIKQQLGQMIVRSRPDGSYTILW